ncbi:unnamed protein product [Protopolystoma xenopodis]|uniref:P-type ATPase C-terminal domain-containing protein n=1 Tax=Protopolystoma xenopodis TaxID=117903 RepID=A0A448WML3_9PLAT|nr:unnamed protein product [Protopolystoma xenopodis]
MGVRDLFVSVCLRVKAVLCCRLTPLQKSEIVRLIKETRQPAPVCAAIGDGANDVSMILEAHVGFGLFGKEGRQAVRSADYAFGRFRFLKRALLVHGHLYYLRVANLVQYFFYKNLAFTLPQILFCPFSMFSAQALFAQVYLLLYNITMTSLPILLYGIFEQAVSPCHLIRLPQLYRRISGNSVLRWRAFAAWMANAVWHALVAFFGVYAVAAAGQAGGGGLDTAASNQAGSSVSELTGFGTLVLMIIFLLVNVKLLLHSYRLTWIIAAGLGLAILGNLGIFLIANVIFFPTSGGGELVGVWTALWAGSGLASAWFCLIGLSVLALTPDLVYRTLADQALQMQMDQLDGVAATASKTAMSPAATDAKTTNVQSVPSKEMETLQNRPIKMAKGERFRLFDVVPNRLRAGFFPEPVHSIARSPGPDLAVDVQGKVNQAYMPNELARMTIAPPYRRNVTGNEASFRALETAPIASKCGISQPINNRCSIALSGFATNSLIGVCRY